MNAAKGVRLGIGMILAAAAGMTGGVAWGDALPGEVVKFSQQPLLGNGQTPAGAFLGHDEVSTATATAFDNQLQPIAWAGTYMADDFADKVSTPIVHLTWWGSYQQNFLGEGGVKRFLVAFESDVPGTVGALSHPGQVLSSQILTLGPLAPGSGTFTQALVTAPAAGEAVYKYNGELNLSGQFPEKANTVYWLKIVALVDPRIDGQLVWGWHDRDWSVPDALATTPPGVLPGEGVLGGVPVGGTTVPVNHFQDDAVQGQVTISLPAAGGSPVVQQLGFVPQNYIGGIDGPDLIGQFSKDLAFELYTPVPEPGSLGVLAVGVLVAARRRAGAAARAGGRV